MGSEFAKPKVMFTDRAQFARMIEHLTAQDFKVLGPVVDQEAIMYGPVTSIDDLPAGWTEEQSPGHYRLVRRDDNRLFGFTVGPHSWKKFLFPPQATISQAEKREGVWEFQACEPEPRKFAFLGVRSCELAAINIQDGIFLRDIYVDRTYEVHREQVLIIAVNCTTAASTCFCTSMQTGPRCESGFDLALTEIEDGFVVEIGTDRGAALLSGLSPQPATAAQMQMAEVNRQQAVDEIETRLDTDGIRDLLLNNLEHPHWDDVAQRCLSCTNCTMVCPTCFCSSVNEISDFHGHRVERQRQWDSCFNAEFSHVVGGRIRDNIRSRYRQWLTHKLASWIDQFGTSGCVGCGRCITWCPVGIDLTKEVDAIRKVPDGVPES